MKRAPGPAQTSMALAGRQAQTTVVVWALPRVIRVPPSRGFRGISSTIFVRSRKWSPVFHDPLDSGPAPLIGIVENCRKENLDTGFISFSVYRPGLDPDRTHHCISGEAPPEAHTDNRPTSGPASQDKLDAPAPDAIVRSYFRSRPQPVSSWRLAGSRMPATAGKGGDFSPKRKILPGP